MLPTEPLPLHHSWPLFERGQRFDHGLLLPATGQPCPAMFRCDLSDDSLTWTSPVYRLFGMAPGTVPDRGLTLSLYEDLSRSAVERLRAHAIRHRRGFTIDAELRPLDTARRWVRITAMPECRDGRAVILHGCKQDVTHEYR